MKRRALSLLLVLCLALGLAGPALAAETAAAIKLSKTTGTVTVSKSSEKPLTLMSNMRLYNGYHVKTGAKSYAWMNLDDTKLIKEDASGEVEVRKSGKKLEVNICSGNVFFNVSEKLEDDESLNISTSTMITGIRGTAGYVQVIDRWTVRLTVLEGEVQCSVTDPVTGQIKTETVRGGESVVCVVYPQDRPGDKCDILREELTVDDIPGFALYDIVRDMDLCDRIKEATGMDITLELAKKAGGDPSGRVPDGDSATPEVLGEADRRQNADEAALQEKQDAVEDAVSGQENNHISPDKVFEPESSSPASESGGTAATTPTTTTTRAMPVTAAELQTLLDQYETVTIQPADAAVPETLTVDTGLTVPAGKTLNLDTGVNAVVPAGQVLQVDGTLNGQSLTNNGATTVTSSNTLRLPGDLTGSGSLTVTDTGHVVVDGVFQPSGALNLTEGAQVQFKEFNLPSLPSGWEVSETADSGGYYSLEYTGVVAPPPPVAVTYTITFDANDDIFDTPATVEATTLQTGTDGRLASLPTATLGSDVPYVLEGWFTALDGGEEVTTSTVFTENAAVYAHWARVYTVIFTATDGYFDDSTNQYTATTGIDGKLSSLPHAYYDGAEESQVLKGWFDAETDGTQITTSTVFSEDTTVYAQWMEGIMVGFFHSYPDYYADEGVQPDVIQTVAIGGTITKPADPTRAGYTFQGWTTENLSDTPGMFEWFDFETTITNDMEVIRLYGMWGSHTVTFHVNDLPNGAESDTITKTTDEFGVLAEGDWPVREDYRTTDGNALYSLVGWSYDGFFVSEEVDDFSRVDVRNEDVITASGDLYAVWSRLAM